MIAPARAAAYEVLRAVNAPSRSTQSSGGATPLDLPSALGSARRGLSDERDRALAGEIATGTLRWQGAFDHLIVEYAGRPLGRLDPEIADILRMGMFQLLHLTRVPASAIVDDAVQLAKRAGKRSAAPLVNAVLRRVSRERDHLPLPARDERTRDAAVAYLAKTLSHPQWLVERWLDRVGFADAERWCRFNNSPAALTVRANLLRTTREQLAEDLAAHDVVSRAARFAPDALVIESGNPLATPLAASGAFFVQDEASQLVALMSGVRPGERVLDACASPGGKTTAMAAAMADDGLIAAADVRPRRVRLLAEAVRRSGASIIHVVHADAAAPAPFREPFDCVLLDAPCSGLGTVRRDPDIKWRRREEDLTRSAEMQTRMLAALADVVRPGGRLLYATCSSEPEENEVVVDRFLETRSDFTLRAPASLPDAVRPLLDAAGCLRTSPARDGLEAFFAAPLVKAAPVR